MGDFYDPEHPTPDTAFILKDPSGHQKANAPSSAEIADTSEVERDHRCIFEKNMDGSEEVEREEDSDGKSENAQKAGFLKGSVFKGVASSRFLPKGTRTKVNLEEQGRQKVSFSFSLTKKTLPNRFLAALGNEKSSESPGTSLSPLPSDFISKLKPELGDPLGTPEEFSPPKPKAELGKIHFKKHLLNVTTKPFPASALPPVPVAPLPVAVAELGEMPSSPPPPPPPPFPPPPPPPQIKSTPTPVLIPVGAPQIAIPDPVTPPLTSPVETIIRMIREPSPSPPQQALELQNTVLGDSEEHLAPGASEEAEPALVKRHSHIGKEEEIADNSKGTPSSKKPRRKFSLSEGALPGSESDEDSVRTSSSQRSHEIKAAASSEKEKDSRKSSVASKMEEPPKVSSRSRSERDDKYSSYSRSERDSRYSSRSRSERERRRSRSRSRSRSERGSRTSSSYSRSERSHYYDSDRRYPRSSPYREKTRYSRSYVDSRVRESSDSEEEYRRVHSRLSTDSRHASSHSSSYRDSRTSSSYSKSERESSKTDSAYPDMERRGKQARSERETRRISESDLSKRSSPVNEPRHRREASHSKAEGGGNSSRSKSTSSKTSAPKSDKFKSSFCCTESEDVKDQSNCVDSETSGVSGCEMKTAPTQKPEAERTVSPVSQFSDSLTFRKLDESKTGSPLSMVNELAGIDSHISIKDTGSLGRHEQLRTSSPVELDVNGSPDRGTRKRLSSSFEEVEEIDLSSDDDLDGSELPPRAKSPKLSSNGLQTLSPPKGHNPDESVTFSGEPNVQLLEVKMEVSNPSSPECVSSFTKQVSHCKTLSKEGSDPTDSSCKTKDPAPCYSPGDTSVSLSYSEIEIEVEPSVDTEAAQEPYVGTHAKIPAQTFTSATVENQNPSELAQENEEYTGFSSAEPTPVRGQTTDEYIVEVDNQQQPGSENALHLETPVQQTAKEVLTCPEVALELDVLPADSVVEEAKSPLKNEHCYYLEMPVKEPEEVPEKEELEEKEEAVFDEGMMSDLDRPTPGVLVMKDKEESLMEPTFSEVLSPSCHIVVTVEETETIEEEPRYGSSCNTPEISSVHNEDYSDTAESASEHPSDESDTEDSDSDDSSVPRNRLQSVVVIPKNSTLTLEESSSCSSRNSQSNRRYVDSWEESRPESTKPFCEDVPDSLELNNNLPIETRTLPSRESERSLATSTELKRSDGSGGPQPEASQPQSDDVDSTSHSEPATDSFHKPDERIVYNETTSVTRSVGVSQGEDLHYLSSFEMTNAMAGASKLDRRQGRSTFAGPSHPADFSREDGFHSTEDLGSLGWDFSQPEKPSTTYQQPDSSYGVFPGYIYPPPPVPYMGSNNYWPDNGYWDPRLTSRPSAISYERLQGQVPDSLTEDHEEYEEVDRWVDESQLYFPDQSVKFQSRDPREKGSVQAHEISSNSAKDFPTVRERKEQGAKAMERNDMKERGPLKKRITDLGSDSESDGGSQERKKIKTESEPLAILPQGSPTGRPLCFMEDFRDPQRWKEYAKEGKMPCYFDLIEENVYLTERKKNKSHRDIKRMLCECPTVSKEELAQGEAACGEDCLNRLLMIECSSRCPNGEHCSNRRFQRKQHADVEVILTEKKGWGLRAAKDLPSNTFVLEYCGEVLDHKEFKTRVKEYARSKNIHYYFMALKNDEIIDATQKGNCSRFMNHSCEPNCETQKWTVNGQLRVGFFTTKLVTSGSELTFDYQFQRYGKEAQKCFCGSTNCRGYLGGENRVSIRAAGGKMKKERSRKKDPVDGELEALLENGEGLSDKNQVLSLSRLMVRIETPEQKLTCLKLIQNTHSQACLKSFLECHGLSLLWIWMAELGDSRGNTANSLKLQLEIIKTLELLPIPNKNMLEESKILPIIQRWARTKSAIPQLSEGDGYSSENTSRAHTPLNTPDPSCKPVLEAEMDTPKKVALRRLKIISENSMDSALSDTASEMELKENKEDLDPPDDLPAEAADEQPPEQEASKEATTEASVDTAKAPAAADQEAEPEGESKETHTPKLEDPVAAETPSQDEEEGVSDVESERSQEPTDKLMDLSDLATKLLDGWKELKLLRAARSSLTSPAGPQLPFSTPSSRRMEKPVEETKCPSEMAGKLRDEVYRIPKKSQVEKESSDHGREAVGRDTPATPKNQSRERDPERQNKEKKKRRESLSPPSAYERGTKRPEDRYDTLATSSKKKVRLKDRSKLSTEERRKLFEQEVAQREAQKQQQQLQNLGMASPLPYDSLGYGASHPPFMGYPPGYPMQAYVDPSNPNAGKVLLPTPSMESMCSPASYEPSQALVGHTMEPSLATSQPVPVVQHVGAPLEVSTPQYVAPSDPMVHQEPGVAVLPVAAPGPVQGQSYGVWDSSQTTVAVQPPYSSAQSQPTIYYQGQACPTVYGVTSPYSQTTPPIVQSYAQPSLQYIQGQQIYTTHPPSVVVQPTTAVATIVTTGQPPPIQQPELVVANNLLDLPPPSPPKPKTIVLPPNWKTARDPEGKIYYYHVVTRQTQWDPPNWDSPEDDASLEHEAEMDLGTPTYDENPMKSSKKPKTAEADTSSELAKKSKEVFRKEMSQFIVQCLNPYRKPDCKVGRITTTEDFKHLARKLTHGVMNKELKYCKTPEDLECNENVKHKTKEYIKKYMQKFGSVYKPKEDTDME
ncbi:PREDICTED: histone-lysine N-methyltransferase SETD2 isoform X3 [Thamnophis sirtalis]|uniref:Histone-lysine N-methyltransferase SETD2 n=1 Tax=Thamnophis sirtalis TaxID=35019 RepID=A0A6I9XTC0_9SAUR|nr:PREDICTED: histone-lysine N-methyltransferase SETD2 isoform X3 [Thamnophis sirtalis]